jgi:hypothetical protein
MRRTLAPTLFLVLPLLLVLVGCSSEPEPTAETARDWRRGDVALALPPLESRSILGYRADDDDDQLPYQVLIGSRLFVLSDPEPGSQDVIVHAPADTLVDLGQPLPRDGHRLRIGRANLHPAR